MTEAFYRHNSADEDKKLAAELLSSGHFVLTQLRHPGAVRYEQVSSTLAYAGQAEPGTVGSDALWQVKRLTFTAAGDVTVDYAEQSAAYDKIWDNRASYSY